MFKSTFKILFVIALYSLSPVSYTEPLTFTTESFPPFNYLENNKVAGPSHQIVQTICQKIGRDCQFTLQPWRRAISQVKVGNYNGIFSVGKNPERELWMYFTHPILETAYGFFVLNDDPLVYESIQDLDHYEIFVYGPSNTSKTLQDSALLVGNMVINVTLSTESSFKRLLAGRKLGKERKGAVYINRDVGNYLIKQMGITELRYLGDHKKIPYHVGFSKISTNLGVVNQFNETLEAMHQSGEMASLLAPYNMPVPTITP